MLAVDGRTIDQQVTAAVRAHMPQRYRLKRFLAISPNPPAGRGSKSNRSTCLKAGLMQQEVFCRPRMLDQ
jgi:hypothetical protein